jgi:hypothetical protein
MAQALILVAQCLLMNKQILIAIFVAAALTIAIPSTTTSIAAHAQNATAPTTGFRHGFHGFLGSGGHFGGGNVLGLGANLRLPTIATAHVGAGLVGVTGVGGGGGAFARAHHEHFIFLNNRYVYLPESVACPGGTQLTSDGQCAIITGQETIVQQEAPTILAEQAAPTASVTTAGSESTITTTQQVSPIVTCQAGSTLVGNLCQTSQTTVQNSAPVITCPSGTLLQGPTCIQQQQQIVVAPLPCPQCPDGSTMTNGQCVVSALPSQVIVGSTPGEIIVSGHHFQHQGLLPFLR